MTTPYEVLDQGEKTTENQAIQNTETKQKINTAPAPKWPGKIFDSLAIFFAKLMWHPNPITWEKFKEEEKIISEKTEKKLEDIMWNVGNLLEKVWDKTIEKVNETAKNINEKIANAEKPKNNQIKLDDIENVNKEEASTTVTPQEESKEIIQEIETPTNTQPETAQKSIQIEEPIQIKEENIKSEETKQENIETPSEIKK